jgi:hypothetical protein
MTEREPPWRRPVQKTVNLISVLADLGHTPESFARLIGRNASGLRRTIRGETKVTPSAARDIIEGLYAEGWKGDPKRIVQLSNVNTGLTRERMRQRAAVGPSWSASTSRAPLHRALSDLMRYLGREEVDWVYERVFGAKPNKKE